MTLEKRLKHLRWKHNWTQAQLAEKLQTHQKQISGYERGVHTPSTDTLIRYAKLFECSLDYLAFGSRSDTGVSGQIADYELQDKMRAIDRLAEADRSTVKAVLDAFILKERFRRLASDEEDEPASEKRVGTRLGTGLGMGWPEFDL